MNRRALKKEWKIYRKECKRNNESFISFEEFIEKALAEQEVNNSSEGESVSKENIEGESVSKENIEGEETEENIDDPMNLIEINDSESKTRCVCKEDCECHELGAECTCDLDCGCEKETVYTSTSKTTQLKWEDAQNYEEYLNNLPTDVKYSELEPELWKTIKNTDTFKNAECTDVQSAALDAEQVLENYRKLFSKVKKQDSNTKKGNTKKVATKKVEAKKGNTKKVDTKKITPKKGNNKNKSKK
ncbi:MAG: hypothetical protein ACRDCG_01770 [Mycoplasmoidaceae bacterium]